IAGHVLPVDARAGRRRRGLRRVALEARHRRGPGLVPGPRRRRVRALGARADAGAVPRGGRAPGPARRSARVSRPTVSGAYPIEGWEQTIGEGFAGRRPLDDPSLRGAVEGAVAALDAGDLRVCSPPASDGGPWQTHAWLKQAILLYFRLRTSAPLAAGEM